MLPGLSLLALVSLPTAFGAPPGLRVGGDVAASPVFGRAPEPLAGAARSLSAESLLRGPYGITIGLGVRTYQIPAPLEEGPSGRLEAHASDSLWGLRPQFIGALLPGNGAIALKLGVGPDFAQSRTGIGLEGRLAWSAPVGERGLHLGPEGSIQTRLVAQDPSEFLLFPCLGLRFDWHSPSS